jgi:hypothetical protein
LNVELQNAQVFFSFYVVAMVELNL